MIHCTKFNNRKISPYTWSVSVLFWVVWRGLLKFESRFWPGASYISILNIEIHHLDLIRIYLALKYPQVPRFSSGLWPLWEFLWVRYSQNMLSSRKVDPLLTSKTAKSVFSKKWTFVLAGRLMRRWAYIRVPVPIVVYHLGQNPFTDPPTSVGNHVVNIPN